MVEEREKLFIDKVQKFLEERGCDIFREVIPDQCFLWEKLYRVDMIVYRKDFGYVAFEGKDLRTLGQGSVIAKAFEQIKKYREYTYFKGIKINKWTILLNFEDFLNQSDRTLEFIRTFFRHYDIYLSYFMPKNKEDFSIGYGFPNSIRFNKWCDGGEKR